ncbi:putative PEP-CTERM system TPR-repeat lipoprotein [Variovorax sp. PBL-H6]|uniref:tetratricopeptide repeat protein n=1 Tax=Variovorax sp. PBL-H6 TaxID=434009 RepID=UPI00131956A6|nr:hypothetical protein [Variovorax sp. PBL-H6]VTU17406.1 putative PEP-CTERM system TPR-repeat lipoprotein [Variovorax sp. PBL-H6]
MSKLKALLRPWFSRSINSQSLWAQADLALIAGNQSQATAIYRGLASAKLKSPEAYLYAGLSEQRLHRPSESIAAMEAGLRQYPDLPLLLEHYVRICSELDQIDRAIRHFAADKEDERQVCEQMFDRYPDSQVQSSLIAHCLQSGFTDLAGQKVSRLLESSDDNVLLWRLADVLLSHERSEEAMAIYRRLAARPAENPLGLVHSALSEYRLGNPERAADMFESGIRTFPDALELIDHFALICAQLRQMNRVVRTAVPGANSEVEACEVLFARFPDPQIQVGLIDHCLSHGLEQLAEQKIRSIWESSDDALALWQVSELLLLRERTDEANAVHRKLAARIPKDLEDYHLSSLAFVCLSELDECLELLEQGLLHYPGAAKLMALYVKICAKRFEYDRYRDFLDSLEASKLPPPVSMLDFYRASMSAPVDFVINLQDIELRVGPSDVPFLRQDFLTYLRKNPQPLKIAKVLVFFCRYLHLPADFSAGVYDALRLAFQGHGKASRALQILDEMTPPMIPRHPISPDIDIGGFIEAALRISENLVELTEPIADMTNNWTPWQYIFCLVAPELYGTAMGAFEKVVFNTWPKLNFTAAHVRDAVDVQKRSGKKLRLGFIVHDSMPMMSGFLPRLDKDRFETVFLRPGKAGKTAAAKSWIARAGKTVQYSDVDMYAAIQTIADEELDIIVSGPSIAAVFYPMMARLAPLQMVLLEPNWTDGLTHADYYISWQPAEPVQLDDFYKTKVSLFRHPPYWIERPEVEQKGAISPEARAEIRKRLLNAGPDARIYLCANTPPKIHPDMDGIFQEILERDKEAILVLLRGEYPPAKTLRSRLRERLGPCYERVVFMSTMSKDDAHLLLQSVDCCLDSYPLCGMSSSFDGAMLGIPTVTLPADVPFGRWTAAIYEYIGAETLIAKSRDDYVNLALRLASDKDWRGRLSSEIKQKSSRYVESEPSSQELEAFLLEAWNRKLQGLAPSNWMNGGWQ